MTIIYLAVLRSAQNDRILLSISPRGRCQLADREGIIKKKRNKNTLSQISSILTNKMQKFFSPHRGD